MVVGDVSSAVVVINRFLRLKEFIKGLQELCRHILRAFPVNFKLFVSGIDFSSFSLGEDRNY